MTEKVAFSVVSLGCARSLVDSEKMVESLQNGGFSLVSEGSREKVTLLNTCSFIQSAVEETERNIQALLERKEKGLVQYLVVAGCYPSRYKREDLVAKYPKVDLWVSTKEEDTLQQQLSELIFKKRFQPNQPVKYTKLTPSHYAYIKISEGCDNWCSFCTIPKIRGKHTSKPLEAVLEEAKKQIAFGAQELLLIAEDTTCWGEDLYGKPSFPLLLKELAKLPVKWIRPMYIFPSRVNQELIDVLASEPRICAYLDMPIQHVNSRLLKAMNRAHDKAHLSHSLSQLKKAIPHLSLRTSLILGFPGETEEDVEELLAFLREHPFDHVGCFAYSEEKETRSAKLGDKVDAPTIQARIRKIMDQQYNQVKARHTGYKGQVVEVIYEGQGIARSYREAPDVDTVILVPDSPDKIPGKFYQAQLTGIKGYDCLAEWL